MFHVHNNNLQSALKVSGVVDSLLVKSKRDAHCFFFTPSTTLIFQFYSGLIRWEKLRGQPSIELDPFLFLRACDNTAHFIKTAARALWMRKVQFSAGPQNEFLHSAVLTREICWMMLNHCYLLLKLIVR